MMAKSQMAMALLALVAAAAPGASALAQNYPISAAQKATATQVAQAGVPLSELAANAPDTYTVKSGDTLWAISRLFLKSPWRWPELWGMNMAQIRNPHLIYPGQRLILEKVDGRATLRLAGDAGPGEPPVVKVSPRTRYEALADSALPTLKSNLIEPFLAEPIVIDEVGLKMAPRIVAAQEERVLLTRGDRAYARGPAGNPLLDAPGKPIDFRVFRDATPLKDPSTGEILGYEAQYLGKARLARGETVQPSADKDSNEGRDIVPATIDVVLSKEEIRVGDRLLPEPPRQLRSYTPHAPGAPVEGRIVSVYGSAVVNAAQNQVVVINRGSRDGMDNGQVLAILKDGPRMLDTTNGERTPIKLPNERNGLLMVFRTFERVSYALILDITDGVKVGDRVTNPR
jgi:nucleoid-associated protein YgaU